MGGYMHVRGYAIFFGKHIFSKHKIKIQIRHRINNKVKPILSAFTCMPPIFSMFLIIESEIN